MAVFNVSIIVHSVPGVSVTMGNPTSNGYGNYVIQGTTYQQVLASLGTDVYEAFLLYEQSLTTAQITQPISYLRYDTNGNQIASPITPAKDPYQMQSSLFSDLPDGLIVINGNSSLQTTILPNTDLNLKLYTFRTSSQPDDHAMNFIELEEAQNVPCLFKEYKNNL